MHGVHVANRSWNVAEIWSRNVLWSQSSYNSLLTLGIRRILFGVSVKWIFYTVNGSRRPQPSRTPWRPLVSAEIGKSRRRDKLERKRREGNRNGRKQRKSARERRRNSKMERNDDIEEFIGDEDVVRNETNSRQSWELGRQRGGFRRRQANNYRREKPR